MFPKSHIHLPRPIIELGVAFCTIAGTDLFASFMPFFRYCESMSFDILSRNFNIPSLLLGKKTVRFVMGGALDSPKLGSPRWDDLEIDFSELDGPGTDPINWEDPELYSCFSGTNADTLLSPLPERMSNLPLQLVTMGGKSQRGVIFPDSPHDSSSE